ncbi:MAG TPA: hypothetical protein VHZ78_09145 [Rhizomicrobium sp.]|jgi:hypothetical protein|nr:hypothetical protein [Rhizomicrobium sp.]
MPKRTTPPNFKFPAPSNASLGVADEAKSYRDDPLAYPADNLYDAIRVEVERLGGGFKFEPLLRIYDRAPPDFNDPSFGVHDEE